MIKKDKLLFGLVFTVLLSVFTISCGSDEVEVGPFPLSADIFNSTDGKQVAFQGLTHSATSWAWDFGDGNTSTEQNPVHVYAEGGYYLATLTVTDADGNTITEEVKLAINLTPYILLTGGPTAANGKTWKLSTSHTGNNDYFAWATPNLDPFEDAPYPLPDGILGSGLGLSMPEVYEQQFTFYFDGGYEINLDAAGGAGFSGLIYQLLTTGGANIVNANGQDFGLCTATYTPEIDASFTYVAEEDFTILSAITGGPLTYPSVTTIDFSGTGYLGFLDYQRKVLIQEITDASMRMVVFASLDFGAAQAGGFSTHAIVLTFQAVD